MLKQLFRTSVERVLRNSSILRELPPEFRSLKIFVSPDAKLSFLKPGFSGFDLPLLGIAKSFIENKSNVWDIGANVGVFAFAAASIASRGSVLAVEPDIWLAQLINRSCALPSNSGLRICVLPSAISDKKGIARFNIASRGRASSFLEEAGGRTQAGGIRNSVYVPTLTLDCLLETFAKPDFVKIDVEGAELLAVRGAERLLGEVRPIFYIEVSDSNADEVLSAFSNNGYLAVDPDSRIVIEKPVFNTLFFPKERFINK